MKNIKLFLGNNLKGVFLMKKNSLKYFVAILLIALAIIYTVLVKTIDVKSALNGTTIGFSTINYFVFNKIGVHLVWYHITDWLGILPILLAFSYAVIGLIEWIKRKRILKVDKEILVLGIFYIVVIFLYFFFEKAIINYRPILIDGFLEASYPSSHTLITVCISLSSILISKKIFAKKLAKILDITCYVISFVTVIGRLISGVHWLTDIIGGLIISSALLSLFYAVLSSLTKSYE